jgi:cytochrome c oxidase assembly protein subunit 15
MSTVDSIALPLAAVKDQSADAKRRRYRRILFLTWFLTLDLIMFGAFVRLTDSGLGCPDWPGCYGNVTPLGALQSIREAAQVMPEGPVTLPKAWIEMVHRYVGSLLGLMIIAICWMAWRYRSTLRRSPTLACVTLFAVCVQGAFGAWTVTHQLMPAVVTAHLLGGMSLLALMTWLAARERSHMPVSVELSRYRGWAALGLGLLFIQIALGGWVSTNYAALACMDFPMCQGAWLPEMDPASGFALVRGLGEMPNGEMISQPALTAIHWVHRNTAWIVFGFWGWLGWRLRADAGLRGPATLVLCLLIAQLLTGLTTIFFQWPLLIAVLHNGGAAGLVLGVVTLLTRLGKPQGQRLSVQSSPP